MRILCAYRFEAATAVGLPTAVAEQAMDALLDKATPDLLLELAKTLPVRTGTVKAVHHVMQLNYARLAPSMRKMGNMASEASLAGLITNHPLWLMQKA